MEVENVLPSTYLEIHKQFYRVVKLRPQEIKEDPMKRLQHSRLFARLMLVLALLLTVAAVTTVAAARAPSARASSGCSVASLNGSYLGNFSGFTGTSTSPQPLALQALATFNGNGTGTASITLTTLTSGGPISFTDTLTYTLNSNCTGTLTAMRSTGQTVHYDIVVVDSAAEVDFSQIDPGFVVTGVQKSQCGMNC
jgi:hypothetical protein